MPIQVNRHRPHVVRNLNRPAHVVRQRHHDIAVRVERHISRTTEPLIAVLHGLRPNFPGRIQCNDTARLGCQIGNNRLVNIGDFAIPNPLPSCKAKFLSRERRRSERLRFIVYERLIIHRTLSTVRIERHRVPVRLPLRRVRHVPGRNRRWNGRRPPIECVPCARHRRRGKCRAVVLRNRLAARSAIRVERHRVPVRLPLRRVRHVPGRNRRGNGRRPPAERVPSARHRRRGKTRPIVLRFGSTTRPTIRIERHRVIGL